MTTLSTIKQFITIKFKDWSIYYRAFDDVLFKELIDSWSSLKPIEVERDKRKSSKDCAEICLEDINSITQFILSHWWSKIKDLFELYKKRIEEWKDWGWSKEPLDHFIMIAKDKSIID